MRVDIDGDIGILLPVAAANCNLFAVLFQVGQFPCSEVRPYSCGRRCGRELECGNHTCQQDCHLVHGAPDNLQVSALLLVLSSCFLCFLQ